MRDLARLRYGAGRLRQLGVLVALVGTAGGLIATLHGDGTAEIHAFERGYAAALAQPLDIGLPGRVEFAARRGPDGLADLYRDVKRTTDAARAALVELRAPAGFAEDVARLAGLLEQQSGALGRLIAATTSQDPSALQGATRALARTAAQASALRSRIQLRLAGAKTS